MGFIIAATYVILSGLIIYLLILLSKRKTGRCVEVRDTILATEELQKHAVEIARNHPVGKSVKSLHWLIKRLNDNYSFITSVYRELDADVKESMQTAPAAEWLLDNFYIIEEQVKLIRRNLSRGQYSRLPILKKGYLKGYPRVYAIALEMVAHSDGSIDERTVTTFIQAYQSQTLLSMGELWAVPLMLRIALVESIRYTCEKIRTSRFEWKKAEETIAYIINNDPDERQLDELLDSRLENMSEISPSFVEHLIQKLRKHNKYFATVKALVNNRLESENSSVDIMTASEHQLQASMQVAIGNSITGLHFLSDLDWSEIFEALSKVEQILRQDPDGTYPQMDFESRDHYRHEVEKLARTFGVSEIYVADRTVECARAEGNKAPLNHVGYYLVGKGRKTLLGALGKYAKRRLWPVSNAVSDPRNLYIGLSLFLTIFLVTYFMYYSATHDNSKSAFWPVITAILLLIPCSEFALNICNTITSHVCRPSMLSKLELKEGIPQELSTFVIIPTLLTGPARARELLHQLEVYYLANREKSLFFALVGDFRDAPSEVLDTDDAIVKTMTEGIRELNLKYATEGSDLFYYMHRKRIYNSTQNRWMGWERKRGAIIEFNRLLCGNGDTGFGIVTGEVSQLPKVKYVITLDADTNLPMGAAKRLIGTIAHPLNRAVVDRETGLVSDGYGLLQPRISVSIPGASRSMFTRIFAGQVGIDPYTTAVSDVYQDIFDEGIFTGKGIYEVDVFQRVLDGRIPENTILSHDLLEGCHLRAGLVSDIELVDGYPAGYISYAARQHRWVRGDWQLLPWLTGKVRNGSGEKRKNNISGLSKWKILDNMRRSLLDPALLLLILAGIGLLPGDDLVWIGFAFLVTISPLTMGFFNMLLTGTLRLQKSNSTVMSGIKAAVCQSVLLFILIPHQAFLMADAIIRTLYRVFRSHKNMLEWVTAADVEANSKNNAASYARKMWLSFPSSAAVLILALALSHRSLIPAAAISILWAVAPMTLYSISKPTIKKTYLLPENDIIMLRKISRKTWRYFEDFANENENFLPPDNFQEDPPKGVAHRTSPTNIGLLLVSIMSACDLGYIGWKEMVDRFENTISTMERMEKWRGHLYNWYDTETLETLRPLYVSTVDSGNLVGYLMVVREGLKEYLDAQPARPVMAAGLRDTLELMWDEEGTGADQETRQILTELSEGAGMDITRWAHILGELASSLNSGENAPVRQSDTMLPGNNTWRLKSYEMTINFFNELSEFYPLHDQPGTSDENRTADNVGNMRRRIDDLICRIGKLIDSTEFSPLFDHKRMLFSIGYDVEDGHLSKSYYDLLASEARQASYISIARGEVDRRHWMRLGRKLTSVDGEKGLVSWTGTMFEYLMPALIMRSYENTIFDETYSFVVRVQKKYGKQRRIPWGISESGYSALDFNLNYQYKAFGVPELGLKRGLANDMVTAPYASILSLGIEPAAVVRNLRELSIMGMDGGWGLYEAIDFTPSRMEKDVQYRIVKSFMAHHQGMSLAALNNFFHSNILQKRFHIDPVIQSAELLLQEKMPEKVMFTREYQEDKTVHVKRAEQVSGAVFRTFGLPVGILPNVHILSNGSYSVMVTDAGSGYSADGSIAVTRWNRDYSVKNGFFIFVQNINSNNMWSATLDPIGTEPEKYRVVFSPDKAEYFRRDGNLETHLEVAVSPEDRAEIRRISVTNHSSSARIIELTSYLEAVLLPRQEDASHPAFSKLFIKTEFVRDLKCLLALRRQRKDEQKPVWLLHTMTLDKDSSVGELQYETSRARFIGRNRDLSNPAALDPDQPLGNSEGSVLDPVMSLRRRIRIEPGSTVKVVYTVAVAQTRKHALELAEKYNDYRTSERTFELSWTRSQVESRYLGLEASETEFYLELLPFFLYFNPLRREYSEYIFRNKGSQQDLWPFGISGDLPVILVEVNDNDDLDMVYWALKGHEFWRMKSLQTDLVILVNKKEGYSQPLNDQVRNAVASSHARELVNRPAGVFIRNSSEMDQNQIALFYTVASLVVRDGIDVLKNKVSEIRKVPARPSVGTSGSAILFSGMPSDASAARPPKQDKPHRISVFHTATERKLQFFNGLAGFSEDGREYVIQLGKGRRTPAPWVNVISNRNFGFLITECGGGYTWAENSREFKLTPWSNDPVTDSSGEAFIVGDRNDNCSWSLTRAEDDEVPYTVIHGHGYSTFQHDRNGLINSITLFAAVDAPVKICIISIANMTGEVHDLSVMYRIRPVLGVDDAQTSPYIVTWLDEGGILFAENKYTKEFSGRVAFLCTSMEERSFTGDRQLFLGRKGNVDKIDASLAEKLPDSTGAGLDPCAAVCGRVRLRPEEEVKAVFLLGSAPDVKKAREYAEQFLTVALAEKELERVGAFWLEKLEAIQIRTPDDSFDVMMNGWLLYQTIACRLWARSGYYQAGGAYGFRDQLQDCMAVLNTWPELAKAQILLHASRQFREGDVQHWWHAGEGKGIRTRYSDDLLWLAYVTAEYLEKTGDYGILKEQAPFLEGSPLKEDEAEKYEQPRLSEASSDIYNHCVLAIDRSLPTGSHGIPLIWGGDWNDGMNLVGIKGSGESVWLGWFLITILNEFVQICGLMRDYERAERYRTAAAKLTESIENEAWDGSWYRRAYFDDGTPLGSVQNSECMIDSISQSWSVVSGVARPNRMQEAMAAVQKYLVDDSEGIIKLLTPPFDEGILQPGYIKGYVPGVRENGGQYTHAAVWVILAFAKLGMGDKAGELFHMLNPVNHTRSYMEYIRYKVEPYVMAADVYTVQPQTGRGGWTWYTGASGWLYKVGLEYIAGFKKKGSRLYIDPCIPRNWDRYEIDYRAGKSVFHIEIKNPDNVSSGVMSVMVDGKTKPEGFIDLREEGYHNVEVVLGLPFSTDTGIYAMGSSSGKS